MKKILFLALLGMASVAPAYADDAADCTATATEKKLAGAAKNSFMKKCQADAQKKSCESQAAEKKLAGAAKNSFTKKCLSTPAAS